jgi:hypothetical protein
MNAPRRFAAAPLPAGTAERLIETVDRLDTLDDARALGALASGLG